MKRTRLLLMTVLLSVIAGLSLAACGEAQPQSTPGGSPGLPEDPYKKELKILAIGNSFSDDCMEYVAPILKSLGAEKVVLGNLYIGGCPLSLHYQNALGDVAAYEYRKNTGGVWRNTPGYRMSQAIKEEDWDVITFQQSSGVSGVPDTYNRDLTGLVEIVKRLAGNAKLAWNMTWAYQRDSTHPEFARYDGDQGKMYAAIVRTVKEKIVTDGDFAFVIPTGTAVQNMRTSFYGDKLTRDGFHLQIPVGRYLAGLTWVKAITGWDISGLAYAPHEVSASAKAACVESAENAAVRPYEVTQSGYQVV